MPVRPTSMRSGICGRAAAGKPYACVTASVTMIFRVHPIKVDRPANMGPVVSGERLGIRADVLQQL